MAKRILDITIAFNGLLLLTPLLLLIALFIRLDSPGAVIFKQKRVGKGFRLFHIYKFRTMVSDAPERGGPITVRGDTRVTRLGRVLRRTKLDELPQLLNVLRGDMSLVGPRPEVPSYVERFRKDYEEILQVRPGITDFASFHYRDEATILGQYADPEEAYIREVLPAKIALAKEYVRHASIGIDLQLILQTLWHLGR